MTARLWVFGDSIAAGTWLADPPAQSWPAQLDAMAGGGLVRNLAIGGQAVAFDGGPALPRMDQLVKDTLLATPAAELPQLLLFAGGTNDLIRTATMDETRWATYGLGVWVLQNFPTVKFLPMTITPLRTDHGASPIALSDRRAIYNTWARAQYGQAGWLMDTGDLLCAGATFADVRWFADSLHPNVDGAGILARGVHTVLTGRGLL